MKKRGAIRKKSRLVPNRQTILRLLKQHGPERFGNLGRATGHLCHGRPPTPLRPPHANAGDLPRRATPNRAPSQNVVSDAGRRVPFSRRPCGLDREFAERGRTDLRRRRRPAPSHPMRQTADCGLPLTHPRALPSPSALGSADFNPQRRRLSTAEAQRQRDGSFLLIENHCPISAAANVCPKLCEAEMEVFLAILGAGVIIERAEHILAGARRCVYRIRTGES